MEAVTKYLLKKNGPLLLSPAYTKPDKMIGYLSRYAPGRRENGGVYTHAAAWAIWAYSKLQMSELSFEVYKKLSPVYNGLNPDEYHAEPYVTPGNIDGPDSPNYGMGGWTWYTGSASWFQKIIFRGTVYNIKVINENHVSTGIRQILADGDEVKNNLLNIKNKASVDVKVYMGTNVLNKNKKNERR
jgi:cellobiose phosphorylase